METKSEIQQLIALSEKPMSGFNVATEINKLIIKVKPKTALFGCLLVFFMFTSLALYYYIDIEPFKYISAIAPLLIGFISLVILSKNATQATFNLSDKSITYENINFVGKLFNKPVKLFFSEIKDIAYRQVTIKNSSSANNTLGHNFVFNIYLTAQNTELQLLTTDTGVVDFEEIESFTTTLKKIIV